MDSSYVPAVVAVVCVEEDRRGPRPIFKRPGVQNKHRYFVPKILYYCIFRRTLLLHVYPTRLLCSYYYYYTTTLLLLLPYTTSLLLRLPYTTTLLLRLPYTYPTRLPYTPTLHAYPTRLPYPTLLDFAPQVSALVSFMIPSQVSALVSFMIPSSVKGTEEETEYAVDRVEEFLEAQVRLVSDA